MYNGDDSALVLRAAGGSGFALLALALWAVAPCAARCEEQADAAACECTEFCHPRFRLHTDLGKEEADLLLKRLDGTLKGAARFFGAPPRDAIEMFVVDRLDEWPNESFTHPAARLLIGGVGGGVVTNGFDDTATMPRKVIVFAAALPGVPEHEIVHAYCVQTFGLCGPTWFKEGIAELLAADPEGASPVACDAEVIDYLGSAEPRTLAQITSGGGEFTAPLAASLLAMLEEHRASDRLESVASMDTWREEHTEVVRAARLEYHWCWSACHFLHQHPDYHCRFKMLARGYVGGQPVDFDEMYAPVRDRLEFEYRFFVERLEPGYRVDLCAWDWRDPSAGRAGKRPASVKVRAGRGYQATGMELREGDCLGFDAQGEWRLSDAGAPVDADGDEAGAGRLEGVLLNEFQLSAPFELGRQGKLVCPGDGKLYLRCRDAWGELADNRGLVRVTLRKSSKP